MSRSKTALIALSFAALAGCAAVPAPQPDAATNDNPAVDNSRRIVSGLNSLYRTLDIVGQHSSLKPSHELCNGLIEQSASVTQRLVKATDYLNDNAASGSVQTDTEKLYAANLEKRAANLSDVFGKLWTVCPAEAKATGLPKRIAFRTDYSY